MDNGQNSSGVCVFDQSHPAQSASTQTELQSEMDTKDQILVYPKKSNLIHAVLINEDREKCNTCTSM